ncbi:hypothetical protein X760_24255 [Mesorhizobium sp. LSHC422A00]|nr:hypothetical protein X760_24255 [Mesorhizobium sp. LSHC422A00]
MHGDSFEGRRRKVQASIVVLIAFLGRSGLNKNRSMPVDGAGQSIFQCLAQAALKRNRQ